MEDSMEFRPKSRHPRHILNEIKWRGLSLDRCQVEILHRGAPHDRLRVMASEIDLGRSTFLLGGVEIPYHRIALIAFEGKAIFRRSDLVKGDLKGD